ncbi:hypothetical protein [Desertivibrio insolitus]|uniref:hypothetical protein n=1 Tax=Herbiconiux sp. SYSU D00978 TaxID=2812562 RepID=UPI001A970575|nr:hypothetical protein [Herbiconiux sp. SYSU D00978]
MGAGATRAGLLLAPVVLTALVGCAPEASGCEVDDPVVTPAAVAPGDEVEVTIAGLACSSDVTVEQYTLELYLPGDTEPSATFRLDITGSDGAARGVFDVPTDVSPGEGYVAIAGLPLRCEGAASCPDPAAAIMFTEP